MKFTLLIDYSIRNRWRPNRENILKKEEDIGLQTIDYGFIDYDYDFKQLIMIVF
jgi:hypothetical protein